METGNIIILDIEKLNSEGAGLARYNNFVVFVNNTCPGDRIKCKVIKVKKNYAVGEILEIINPSEYRTEPKCKLQKVCGGCTLQHISYEKQIEYKKIIVEDTLYSILGEKLDVRSPLCSGENYGYRCKIQYPVRSKKESDRLLAGYFKPGTHELLNIKYCPIHPQICDEIIEFIKTEACELGVGGYNELDNSGILRHIVLRYSNYNHKILVVLVLNLSTGLPENIKKLALNIYAKFDVIKGVAVNFNNKKTNVILGENTQLTAGQDYIEENLLNVVFKVGADTFFQVNPACANLMFNFIKDYISKNFTLPLLLDAYAGIAAFGITLAPLCKKAVSVELNPNSVKNAISTAKEYNINNIDIISSDSLEYMKQSKDVFDITILDPPRKGCGEEVLNNVLRITKNTIIYVSCSPKSLAQDLKFLLKKGCSVKFIQPFDMFPNTPHVENVVIIKINK